LANERLISLEYGRIVMLNAFRLEELIEPG